MRASPFPPDDGATFDAWDGTQDDITALDAFHAGLADLGPTTFVAYASPTLAAEVSFITGVNDGGVLQATSFHTWKQDTPASYGTSSNSFKWGSGHAGTSGGIVTYAFDAGSNWTDAEQAALRSGLSMWAAVANVSFSVTSSAGSANLLFKRGTDGQASTSSSLYSHTVGTTTLQNPVGTTTISIDTGVNGFGPLGSFTTAGGYPVQVVLHEEGHALGLGHAGPYNGSVNSGTQQFSAYDSRMWTVMSYVSPTDTSSQYASSNPVQGTNWGGQQATTWMPLDILAIQQLYGVAQSTPLSGGQRFGFNCNITGDLQPYFDFTQNTAPVLTLWDKGVGNTLDLSGYSTSCTINLNAGTFSSFAGLTNNLAIAYSTAIDTVVGGAGDDSFKLNGDSDTVDGGGGTNTVVLSGQQSTYALGRSGATVTVTNLSSGVIDTLTNIQTLTFSDTSVQTSTIACYLAGTLIDTPGGPTPVEALQEGDQVSTANGRSRPVLWIGRRSYAGRFLAASPQAQPVRFVAGCLGDGLPRRDLLVSPKHAMLLDGALVPAECLINGRSIRRERGLTRVDYVHVELDTHDVLLAEGAPSESFVDDGGRAVFHNAHEHRGGPAGPVRYCAPRVEHGPALAAIRSRLARLAA